MGWKDGVTNDLTDKAESFRLVKIGAGQKELAYYIYIDDKYKTVEIFTILQKRSV